MRCTIVDALPDPALGRELELRLASAGASVGRHRLRQKRFAPCQGCFECWVDHPGTCKAKDHANTLMEDVIGADAMWWLTEPRFGCWDPVAKVALDKSLALLSPFFARQGEETHHHKRYARYPRWHVLARGVAEEDRAAFRRLVECNAVNLHTGDPQVAFVEGVSDLEQAIQGQLAALAVPPTHGALGPVAAWPEPRITFPLRRRHAVVLVGSPKAPGTSTSEALAGLLTGALAASGWTSETLHVARVVKLGRDGAPILQEAASRADLLLVASPVYWDCLPAPVLAALGHLVDAPLVEPPAIGAVLQCGFPEAKHAALAVRAVKAVTRDAGWPWAGFLAAGGGPPLVGQLQGDRLPRHGGALRAAARALAEGRGVPLEASLDFAAPVLRPFAYRAVGNVGWVLHALRRGRSPLRLWDRPFEVSSDGSNP